MTVDTYQTGCELLYESHVCDAPVNPLPPPFLALYQFGEYIALLRHFVEVVWYWRRRLYNAGTLNLCLSRPDTKVYIDARGHNKMLISGWQICVSLVLSEFIVPVAKQQLWLYDYIEVMDKHLKYLAKYKH